MGQNAAGRGYRYAGAVALLSLAFGALTARAQSTSNPIQIENQQPGTSAWLLTNPAMNHEIEGYASATSVNQGQSISFFVNTSDPSYTLTIYRIGWYGGLGGRQMLGPVTLTGIAQPTPAPDPTTGLIECQWTNPYTITVPTSWTTGFYLVKLTATSSGKQAYIIFVVRDDGYASDILFQSSVTTYQAYNAWGGKSLYPYNSTNASPAVKVSFNRPYDDSYGAGEFLEWELNMVAFLEEEGYNLSYSTDVDTHERGGELLLHKAFLSVGHDEYWSYEMRQNVTAARDAGVNLGFFSANDCFWQIRFEPSPITGAPDRTIVGYKDYWPEDPDAQDPSTYYLVTTAWYLPHVTDPGDSEAPLIGPMFNFEEPVNADIVISDASSWVFANTGLSNGSHLTGLAGYEVDAINGASPGNITRLAHSPYQLNGNTYYSDMTIYTAASGALVFATGTIQWSYGLSNLSPWSPSTNLVSAAARTIITNVLNKFVSGSFPSPTPTGQPTPTPAPSPTPAPAPTASGIGLRGFSTSFADDGTGIVLPMPSEIQPNDVLLAQITAVNFISNPIVLNPPSGWALLKSNTSSDGTEIQAIYSHIAGNKEPPAYVWLTANNASGPTDIDASGGIAAYYHVDNESPIDAFAGMFSSSSTSIIAPSVTTTRADDRAVFFMSTIPEQSGNNWTLPSGMTERWLFPDAANDTTSAMADQALGAAGTIGPFVTNLVAAIDNAGTIVVLAAPLMSTPTPTGIVTTPTPTSIATATIQASGTPSPTATASASATATLTATPTATATGVAGPIGVRGAQASYSDGGTAVTLAVPAGVQAGDVLLAQVSALNYNVASIMLSAPAGWNLVRQDRSSAGDNVQAIYVRVAGGSEPASYSWPANTTVDGSGGIVAYYNVNTANPIDTSSGQYSSGSSTVTAPSLTTTHGGEELAAFMSSFLGEGSGDWTLPAGMTQRWIELDGGYDVTAALADSALGAAGATGTRSASIVAAPNAGALVALVPAGTPSSATPTATLTPSPSPTNSPTPSPAATPSPTATASASATATLTATPTATATGVAGPIGVRGAQASYSDGGTAVTLAVPAGVQAGDVLLAQVSALNYNVASIMLSAPAGWNLVRQDRSSAGDNVQAIYVRVAGGSEPASYSWPANTTVDGSGGIVAYYNVNTANPIDTSSGQYSSGSSTVTAPSLTTTHGGEELAAFMSSFLGEGSGDWTLPAGMTQRWIELDGGYDVTAALADSALGAAGATGTRSASIVTAPNAGALVALVPAGQ